MHSPRASPVQALFHARVPPAPHPSAALLHDMPPVSSLIRIHSVERARCSRPSRAGRDRRACWKHTARRCAASPSSRSRRRRPRSARRRWQRPKPVRTLIGDVALILRTDRPGTLRIGVAGESRSLSLSVRATDARRWADSASKLLSPASAAASPGVRRARRPTPPLRQRAVLEEPGVGAGTFVLLRIDSASTRNFLLFVDDATLQGIRQPLEPDEAKLLVRLVRGAAAPPRAAQPQKEGAAEQRRREAPPLPRGRPGRPSAGSSATPTRSALGRNLVVAARAVVRHARSTGGRPASSAAKASITTTARSVQSRRTGNRAGSGVAAVSAGPTRRIVCRVPFRRVAMPY